MKSAFDVKAQNHNIDHKIVVGLERISEAFRVLLWDESKKTGLSPIQIQILVFLSFHDETTNTPSYLAKEFNVTKATITDSVRILLEKGLIQKIPDPQDARSYKLIPTDQGNKIANESASFSDELLSTLEGLSTETKNHMISGLYQLVMNLNQRDIISAQRMCKNCQFFESQEDGNYCHFLKTNLTQQELRLDCPEFEAL